MSVFGETAGVVGRFFDDQTERYEERMASPYHRMMREITWRQIRRHVPREKGARILDAGGATGYWSVKLARAGYSVVLLDVSEKMLETAKANISVARVSDRVEVVHGDITDLREFSEGSFDMVLAVEEPLSFASDPEMAVAEMALVTKAGGTVAASVANRLRWQDFAKHLKRGDVEGLERLLGGGGDAAVKRRSFTAEEIEALFSRNGLEIQSAVAKGVFAAASGGWLADPAVFARVLAMELAYNANRGFWGSADVLEFVATKS
jgi:ubiquinone/menaquinone biosynthesis C-methylase UbiE